MDQSSSEFWKPVPGYEGMYEVSDLGNVRALRRTSYQGSVQRTLRGGKLAAFRNTDGYLLVRLFRDGIGKNERVNRLVARAFLGEPQSGQQVNHINGDRRDNRLVNLEWVTPTENMLHQWSMRKQAAAAANYVQAN